MDKEGMRRKIERARATGNTEQLRVWGKRGAEAVNKKRQEHRDLNAYFDDKLAAQNDELRTSANEHIVPIDPDDTKEAA